MAKENHLFWRAKQDKIIEANIVELVKLGLTSDLMSLSSFLLAEIVGN